MSSLNTDKIVQLAKEKTVEKEKLALESIGDLRKEGRKVTFYSVAKQTGLSKTFLYNNDSVRQEIEEARASSSDGSYEAIEEGSLGAEKLIDEIEKMKIVDPDGYEKIRAAIRADHS